MKRRISFVLASAILVFLLPSYSFSAEKSVIVGFRKKPGASEKALIRRANGVVRRTYRQVPLVAASLPEEQIERLRRNPRVRYVEETGVYWTATAPGGEYTQSWGVQRISADTAHANGHAGAGVKVAVLDTGIDYGHEDLDDNYRGGIDFVFGDDDPFDDSFNSHGTHVAGIVAAEQNGVGTVGVAPEVDLYAVKVLDGAGFGLEDWIIAGIDWAIDNEIDVINLSIEGPDRPGLRDACDRAYEEGILVVAAGGNSELGGAPVAYPAAYDSVIAVTATNVLDMPGYFSPFGNELELAAPGVDIYSTTAGGEYAFLSGTSQAAPHVAGAAALYLAANNLTPEEVRLMLQQTAIDLGEAARDPLFGFGLVNAEIEGSGDSWQVQVPSPPSEFTVRFEPLGGFLSVETTYPDGTSSTGLGIEFPGVIFWMDITGNLFFGNINRTAGTMSGVVFGGPGGSGIWSGQKI